MPVTINWSKSRDGSNKWPVKDRDSFQRKARERSSQSIFLFFFFDTGSVEEEEEEEEAERNTRGMKGGERQPLPPLLSCSSYIKS